MSLSLNRCAARKVAQNFRWGYLAVKNVTTQVTNLSHEKQTHEPFVKVFEMPTIRVYGVISRLKVWQTAISGVSIPASLLLNYTNVIENAPITIGIIVSGVAGCIALYSTGFVLNNLIGAVYVNESLGTVKLSHIGFWGKRIDIICPASDIVPLTNEPIQKRILKLTTVRRYSSSHTLRIATEHGVLLQPRAFDEVFFRESTDVQKQNAHLLSSNEK